MLIQHQNVSECKFIIKGERIGQEPSMIQYFSTNGEKIGSRSKYKVFRIGRNNDKSTNTLGADLLEEANGEI